MKRWLSLNMVVIVAAASFVDETLAVDATTGAPQTGAVEFSRDVLPILSANCFSCHGPDESQRQADLRLDLEQEAKQDRDGRFAIAAGDSAKSEIVARMLSSDPNEVMPPPEFNRTLEPEQIETIRRWIDQGATWQRHWAFEAIAEPTGDIDSFVNARLEPLGLAIQPQASPATLARRLSLDLVGLPPSPAMVDAFKRAANAPETFDSVYQQWVDTLLEQPTFGEHWARMWLDLARYADTKGYEKDRGRTMWPYRDWVIDAFNRDMPLDEFTKAQLAGDLIEGATTAHHIATAFHRNTMSNDEGGTDDEEFRVAAVKDRINSTVQVWMGLTMGCAQCHTHKYDPISIDDYYRFYAIFNQTADADRPDDSPKLEILSDEQRAQRDTLAAEVKRLKDEVALLDEANAWTNDQGETLWLAPRVDRVVSIGGAELRGGESDHAIVAGGKQPAEDTYEMELVLEPGRFTAIRLEALPSATAGQVGAVGRSSQDPNFVVSELQVASASDDSQRFELVNSRADFAQEGWPVTAAIDGDLKTGWAVSPRKHERHIAIFDFAKPLECAEPTRIKLSIVQNYGGSLTLARYRVSFSQSDPASLLPQTETSKSKGLRDELAAVEKKLSEVNAVVVQLPVMKELAQKQRRETRTHVRGNFLEPGDVVEPAVLASFHRSASSNPTRLDVATWLVSNDNPLTPRVWANRVWARVFGRGLVETEEDFGTLGALPSHPELLDWLAAKYRDGGWSHKQLLKLVVMSDTYRQSSSVDAERLAADPDNRWLSRAPRFRLSGEVLRDQALAVAGLLSSKMSGPPVMPPQPDGLWRSTYSGEQWINAEGEDRYRRGIYTYLKRTTPYPSFITFDGGSGEVCLIRRIRTNTPLQALVTMNDPVFLEAAAGLEKRMHDECSRIDDLSRIVFGMRLALQRTVRDEECRPLLKLRQAALEQFEADPASAAQFIASSRCELAGDDAATRASWIVVASAILNLDEFLTRN